MNKKRGKNEVERGEGGMHEEEEEEEIKKVSKEDQN